MSPERPIPTPGRPLNQNGGDGPQSKPGVPDHELLRRVGAGAYGEVWLARNVLGTYRAVKIVHRNTFRDERTYEREFRGIRQFEPISRTNEGLLHILQAGRNEEAGYYYYVMELADAAEAEEKRGEGENGRAEVTSAVFPPFTPAEYQPRTLDFELRRRGHLPAAECVQFGLSLTLALGHLHRHGLIHRDIKPANIIFVGGIPKLADIGLVTSFEDTCSFVGTEGFVAPEGPTSPRADLYSLGKVLYELSTGKDRKDFPEPATGLGENPLTPALSPSDGEREKGRGAGEALEELNAIILKACAADARNRYQTAAELHADLALLNSGKSVRWKRLVERRLAFARKAGAVVGVVAVLATGGYLFQRHQTREAVRLERIAEGLAARMQVQNAENLFARGDSSSALAHLAQILRRDPRNRVAAERILAALGQRDFPRLALKPLVHPAKLNTQARPRTARFSPDGQFVVTLCADRTVHLWNARTGEETIPPHRHQGEVVSAEFSPDGAILATASSDKTVCVVEVRTGALVFPPLRHEAPVSGATFSPDGQWLATAAADGNARVFHAATGELLRSPFLHASPINAIAFSPDSHLLAAATEGGEVKIWHVNSGQEQRQFQLGGPVRLVRFSGDGNWVAATIDQLHASDVWRVQVWNVQSGEPVTGPLFHQHRIYSLEFSPDSQRLVTATAGNVARVWRVKTGEELFQLRHSALVYSAEFSPDGRQLLTASVDHTARLWDATTGEAVSEPMLHDGRVTNAEFSLDGKRVLTAGWDKTVKLWEVRPRRALTKKFRHNTWVVSAEFDDTGQEAITATGGTVFTANSINRWATRKRNGIRVLDVAASARKFRPVLPEDAEALAAQFTRNGPKALISKREMPAVSRQAWLWDFAKAAITGEAIQHEAGINCARFSDDGHKLATGATDGTARIWDANQSRALTPPLVHKGRVNSVRFNRDGKAVITASEDGTATIWDTASGQQLAPPLTNKAAVWFAQFSPQGDRALTVSLDYFARVWSTNGAMLAELKHSAPVEYAEFSPDGTQVVTASGDRTARLWSATTGQQLIEPLQHAELVFTARFSADGLRVITASMDRTAQVWDVATGLKLGDPFRHDDWVVSACFSPTGRQAITASSDGTAKIWEVPLATSPIPPWLSELAEAMGGQRLSPDGIPEPVSWTEFADLKARLSSTPSSDSYFQWAQRLFADPTTPTNSPNAAARPAKPSE